MSSEQFGDFNLDLFVLRCERCNKPFDKETSLKRHRYYCRSKSSTAALKPRRTEACSSCAKKKWGCDLRKPECSRCLASGLKCRYSRSQSPHDKPGNKLKSPKITTANQDETSLPQIDAQQPARDLEAESILAADLDSAIDWDKLDFNFTSVSPDLLDVGSFSYATKDGPLVNPAPLSMSQAPYSDLTPNRNLLDLSFGTSMPMSLVPNLSLVQRSQGSVESQKIASLMLSNLKSYPRIIIQGRGLPPFVHSTMLLRAKQVEDDAFQNCVRLLRTMDGPAAGNRKLFWRCVKSECEHIIATVSQIPKFALMSALQAVLTYFLVLIAETPSDVHSIASILHATTCLIGQELARQSVCLPTGVSIAGGADTDSQEDWDEWVLDESKRRVRVVAMIINMLYYFDPATVCTMFSHLSLGPLPSKKQLWEAGTVNSWNSEIQQSKLDYNDYGLALNGDLAVMHLDPGLTCSQMHSRLFQKAVVRKSLADTAGNWEEWCTGMDGFGSLIMLAASLGQ